MLIELASIAIWNKNRAVIVLGTCVWGIYLAFFIQGESSLLPDRRTEAAYWCYSVSGISQVKNQFLKFYFVLNCVQLRSEWLPGFDTCTLPNMERDKLAYIITFAIDLTLVLIMFLGLLRLRGRGGGMFGLARLLWKQVRPWQLSEAEVFSIP